MALRSQSPLLAIVLILVGLTGCDSAADNSEGDPIIDLGAIPDETMGARDTLTVALSNYFSLRTGRIDYSATSESGALQLVVDGSQLDIVPLESATDVITVTANALESEPVEQSFSVTVLCPILKSETEGDYMPIESGSTWTYDYLRLVADSNDPEFGDVVRQWEGTLTLSVTQYDPDCDEASIRFSEVFDGVYVERDADDDDVLLIEDHAWTETYDAAYDGDRFVFDAYLSEFDGSMLRFHPFEAPDILALDKLVSDGGLTERYSILFERGIGLREVSISISGTGVERDEQLTLLP